MRECTGTQVPGLVHELLVLAINSKSNVNKFSLSLSLAGISIDLGVQ